MATTTGFPFKFPWEKFIKCNTFPFTIEYAIFPIINTLQLHILKWLRGVFKLNIRKEVCALDVDFDVFLARI